MTTIIARGSKWLPVITLVFGLGSGFALGFGFEHHRTQGAVEALNDLVDSSVVANAALQTTEYTSFLKLSREGQEDRLRSVLEIKLDYALINLARAYGMSNVNTRASANAARSQALAREYRAIHPHQPSDQSVDQRVAAALALQITEPIPTSAADHPH